MRKIVVISIILASAHLSGCAGVGVGRYTAVEIDSEPYLIDQQTGIIYNLKKRDNGNVELQEAGLLPR